MVISRKYFCLQLTLKRDWAESVVNYRNVNTVWATLQENRLKTHEEILTSTTFLKTLIFHILRNLQLWNVCSRCVPLITLLKNKCEQEFTSDINGNGCFKNDPDFLKTSLQQVC